MNKYYRVHGTYEGLQYYRIDENKEFALRINFGKPAKAGRSHCVGIYSIRTTTAMIQVFTKIQTLESLKVHPACKNFKTDTTVIEISHTEFEQARKILQKHLN